MVKLMKLPVNKIFGYFIVLWLANHFEAVVVSVLVLVAHMQFLKPDLD